MPDLSGVCRMGACSTKGCRVSTPELIQRLRQRSSWRPILQSTFNIALFLLLAILTARSETPWLVRIVAWPLMGLVLAGFLNAAHDCAHSSFLDSKRLNYWAGVVWCVPLLISFGLFKSFHLTHHKFNRRRGDPEPLAPIGSISEYCGRVLSYNPFRNILVALRVARSSSRKLAGCNRVSRNELKIELLIILSWLALAVSLTVFFPTTILFAYWIPLLTFGPVVQATALPEHHGRPLSSDVFENTRTILSGPIVRAVLWNSGFHAEHHLFPFIPSCNLPILHKLLDVRRDRDALTTYSKFHLSLLSQLLSGSQAA